MTTMVPGRDDDHQVDPAEGRQEWRTVMAFLERNGYRITRGYGRDEESAHFQGHRLRRLGELYREGR